MLRSGRSGRTRTGRGLDGHVAGGRGPSRASTQPNADGAQLRVRSCRASRTTAGQCSLAKAVVAAAGPPKSGQTLDFRTSEAVLDFGGTWGLLGRPVFCLLGLGGFVSGDCRLGEPLCNPGVGQPIETFEL